MPKHIKNCTDLIGKKYNRLTIIGYEKRLVGSTKKPRTILKCQCDCGKVCFNYRSLILNEKVLSCGCYNRDKKRKYGEDASWARYFFVLQNIAKRKNLEFSLSLQDVKTNSKQNCHYCGVGPREWLSHKNAYLASCKQKRTKVPDLEFANSKVIFVQGIDRIDSYIGYTINNIVPCCFQCNGAKNFYSISEFKNWITRVYSFYIEGKS